MNMSFARHSMTEAEKAALIAQLRAVIDSLDHSVAEQMAVKGILLAVASAIEYGDLEQLSMVIMAFCMRQVETTKKSIAAAILGGGA